MKLYEQEWVEKIKRDFKKLKIKQKFSPEDEGRFLADLTGLLGWLNIDPGRKLKNLIEEMLIYGEKKKWSIAGPRIAFEHIKKRHQLK